MPISFPGIQPNHERISLSNCLSFGAPVEEKRLQQINMPQMSCMVNSQRTFRYDQDSTDEYGPS